MYCRDCMAYGKDHISTLCVARLPIKTLRNGNGCNRPKKVVEKRLRENMSKYSNRYTLINREKRNETFEKRG